METDAPLLPQDPPSWIIRLIAWLLCGLALAVAGVAIFVKLPETVRVPFTLVSQGGDETLLAPMSGVLVRVDVAESAEVAQGTVLFVLRSDEIRRWQTERSTEREALRALDERRGKLDEIQAAQVAIKDAQIVQMQREVAFREKHFATNLEFVGKMEELDRQGGVPRIEMLSHRLNLAASEKDLLIAQKSLQQETLELAQMKAEWERQRLDEESTAAKLRISTAALERQLAHCEGDELVIRAPYDAIVVGLNRRSGGNVIQAGEPLGQLARLDEQPHARLQLDESALARLRAGQGVRYFFAAYPYQRYGSITGELQWVTPAAVASPGESRFMADASLDRTTLPGAGQPLVLRVGMQGEARIMVGRRTLVESVFEPIRQLRENLRR